MRDDRERAPKKLIITQFDDVMFDGPVSYIRIDKCLEIAKWARDEKQRPYNADIIIRLAKIPDQFGDKDT
jgi:hypothetical protein